MNCDWVKERIFSYLDEEVSPEDRGNIDAHLTVCPACAEEMACFTNIQQTARVLDELKPSDYFELRLKRRLEASPKFSILSLFWQRKLAWAFTLPVLVFLSFIVVRFYSSRKTANLLRASSTPSVQVEADYYYLDTESASPGIQYVEEKELDNGASKILVVPVLSYADQSY
jgi:anti-sigma factor RsiW